MQRRSVLPSMLNSRASSELGIKSDSIHAEKQRWKRLRFYAFQEPPECVVRGNAVRQLQMPSQPIVIGL